MEDCNLAMHFSVQTKLIIHETEAIELREVEDEFEDEDQTEQDEGIFQSTCLDVEATLGSTNFF